MILPSVRSESGPIIGLLDTSLESQNLGDSIILESVNRELQMAQIEPVISLPTHRRWSDSEKSQASVVDFWILSGTNILGSRPFFKSQWPLGFDEINLLAGKVLLFGCGWQKDRSFLNKGYLLLLKYLLSKKHIHSVRDSMTKRIIQEINGLKVLNTSCPTLWNLETKIDFSLDRRAVVATLTDYSRNHDKDSYLLSFLKKEFETVYLWPQGSDDQEYARYLSKDLVILDRTLEEFNSALNTASAYVGTRLHAGIKALQLGLPYLIVSVDNRAREIGKDTNLNVFSREKLEKLTMSSIFRKHELHLPLGEIKEIRNQIGNLND